MIDFDIKSYIKMPSILPNGEYNLRVKNAELRNTKANDGSRFLSVKFEVLNGPFKGKHVDDMFNIYNTSDQCQEIGRKKFAAFCDAINIIPKSFHEVEGCLVCAKVSEDSYQGQDKNKIDKYMPIINDSTFQAPPVEGDPKFNDDIPF